MLDEMNATLLPLSDPTVEPWKIHVHDYIVGVLNLFLGLVRIYCGLLVYAVHHFRLNYIR